MFGIGVSDSLMCFPRFIKTNMYKICPKLNRMRCGVGKQEAKTSFSLTLLRRHSGTSPSVPTRPGAEAGPPRRLVKAALPYSRSPVIYFTRGITCHRVVVVGSPPCRRCYRLCAADRFRNFLCEMCSRDRQTCKEARRFALCERLSRFTMLIGLMNTAIGCTTMYQLRDRRKLCFP